MKFNKSLSLLKEAKELIPSAAQTYSKSYQCFCEGAAPAFLEKGEGCRVVDIDGNVYLDFLLGLGPVTIGYNNKRVNKAITDQLAKGISFTQPHPIEVKLARKIVDIVPCAQMVKFVKNGSDATTAAIRLARAFTRRDLVLCCGYHGFHDWYVGITSNNKGVPKNVSELTRAFQYNNLKSLETLFQENKGRVAAVIIEPISIEKPLKGFLENISRLCAENGAVLIFDEVVTGFRLALGGAQAYYGVVPDLCCMGKGIANGMPLSLIAGKKEIMQMIDKGAFVSTTFGGETLSIASALETIQIMEDENYFEHTWGLGRLWLENVDNIIREKKASQFVRTAGLPPHSGVVFNDFGPVSSEDFKTLFIQEIISNGIISLGINNFCLAHTRSDVEQYTKAVSGALDVCIKALKKGSADSFFKGGKFLSVFTRN
ncbi:MAG: aminotransferase class III-fold pyridoxal phosphate-dependent enzyme [Desulfobacula sp.]|jgi:glutamate-1-semialdehyde aminotransferase|nr:aminotransferase class III-fold pyridoxal phosphate-dependent enzyme [Desulfobacula sp.]